MYRIVLACKGVPADVGEVAARDITEEFAIGRSTRMYGVSGMGLDSFCKPIMTSTRTALLCWMSSLTQFQPPLRMASTAVSMLFLLAPCRLTPPTESMNETRFIAN